MTFNTAQQSTLAATALGQRVVVCELDLDEVESQWVEAVGLSRGAELVVLRRAAWGGPLHVRTSEGAELAVARSLARSIRVVPATAEVWE